MTPTKVTNPLAKCLRTVGDDSRLNILCVLIRTKKSCVSDIAEALHTSVASVSHHLLVLAKEGILVSKREGKQVSYSLSQEKFVTDLKKFICKYK